MFSLYRRYYVIPILYTIIVLILLFNERSKDILREIRWTGDFKSLITVSKKDSKVAFPLNSLPELELEPLAIGIELLLFSFQFTKLTNNTNNSLLALRNISPIPRKRGIHITLVDNTGTLVSLDFLINSAEDKEYSIVIKNLTRKSISIPFSLKRGASFSLENNQIDIQSQRVNNFVSLSPNIEVKETGVDKEFHIQSQNAIIKFSNKKNRKNFKNLSLDLQDLKIEEQDISPIIQSYINKSYYSWLFLRYQKATGTWAHPRDIVAFSEDILVAAYAEAAKRNELAMYKLQLERAAFLHENNLTWKSLPIVGSNTMSIIEHNHHEFLQAEPYIRSTKKINPFLSNYNFLQNAYLFYSPETQEIILEALESIPTYDISPEFSAALLFQLTRLDWNEAREIIEPMRPTLEFTLMNNFVSVDLAEKKIINTVSLNSLNDRNALMISTSSNQLNVETSLLTAIYLIQHEDRKRVFLGKKILSTLLLYSDKDGFLPHWFSVSPSQKIVESGYLLPESLYTLLTQNEFYPTISAFDSIKVLSLNPYTYSIQNKKITMTISMLSPNITTYSYIFPVPRLLSVFAFNAYWKGNYSLSGLFRGIHYNTGTDTVMIKSRSKNTKETISIQF